MKHAPRGRIKASGDPLNTPDPLNDGKCVAHSKRTGARCQKFPIAGGTVCRFHGGAAPQVKAKALERLMAMQDPAITRLLELVQQKEYPSTAITAVKDVLDRTMGRPVEQVDMRVSGGLSVIASRIDAARKRLAVRDEPAA